MNSKFTYRAILSSLFVMSSLAVANEGVQQEYLVAPKCFISNNNFTHEELAYNKEKDLVLFSVEQAYWWDQLAVLKQDRQNVCGKFINVNSDLSDFLDANAFSRSKQSTSALDFDGFLQSFVADETESQFTKPASLLDQEDGDEKVALIEKLFSSIQKDRVANSLDEFTGLFNRGANTQTGVEAAEKLKTWMEDLRAANNLTEEQFSVELVATNQYRQPSVVAVLGKDLPGEAIVLSAHLDTLGGGRMPGADDNASGSMVVLEAARVLLESKQTFNRPIYFMWYAAEEMGLVGSKVVVKDAKAKGFKVDSVFHMDIVGYRPEDKKDDPTFWFLRDYVNKDFTDYLAGLTTKYVKVPVNFTRCGYACSDHASWTKSGYVSAAVLSTSFSELNPNLHSDQDSVDTVSVDGMVNFAKLSLAYVVDKAS